MGVRKSGNIEKHLKRLLRRCNDFSKPMRKISVLMKKSVQNNFDNETSYTGEKWTKSKRASEDNGKTLQDTGRLYNSIQNSSDKNRARVGTNVKYARALNYGVPKGKYGRKTARIRPFYRSTPSGKKVKVRGHKRRILVPWGTIPKYEYMGINDKMRKQYREIILNYLIGGKK